MVVIKCMITRSDDIFDQFESCSKIVEQIDSNSGSVTLDLSSVEWIMPLPAVWLANKISQLEHVDYIDPKNNSVKTYLIAIGFPLGNKKNIGSSYCPIIHFSENPEEAIEKAAIVVRKTLPKQLVNAIMYILSELCDNIDQHSHFSSATIMAQYYAAKGWIDISVLDNGISIPGSFENSGLLISDDSDAIADSLEGLSTKKEEGRGQGLQSTRKLLTRGLDGELCVFSRSGGVKVLYDSESNKYTKDIYGSNAYTLQGTLVYGRFRIPANEVDIYKWIEPKQD